MASNDASAANIRSTATELGELQPDEPAVPAAATADPTAPRPESDRPLDHNRFWARFPNGEFWSATLELADPNSEMPTYCEVTLDGTAPAGLPPHVKRRGPNDPLLGYVLGLVGGVIGSPTANQCRLLITRERQAGRSAIQIGVAELPAPPIREVRGMRLPNDTKVAFSSEALFKQQCDMRTHDAAVQQMLTALCAAANAIFERSGSPFHDVPLTELKFNVNFADAALPYMKVFKVQLTHPEYRQFDLEQRINMTTLSVYWRVRYNDWELEVNPSHAPVGVVAEVQVTSESRPLRSIEVD